MKNIIYIHVCCVNNWQEVLYKLFHNIQLSGLYHHVDEIRCVVLARDDCLWNECAVFNDTKVNVIFLSNDISLHEFKIMELIYEHSLEEDFNMLYLHTKGIRHYGQIYEQNVKDWVDYMIYYNIIKWMTCLEELKDCDVVGVNLQKDPWHFSGNFWWSKSSHIKTLGVISDRSYNGPEFYITSKSGTYVSLFNSNVNHYHEGYPYELYHNKVKRMIICKSD